MTYEETEAFLAVLVSAYPRATVGEGTVAVYARMLRDITAAEAEAALDGLLSSCVFLPTIAEIRAAVLSRRHPLASGEEAWAEVMAAIRDVGIYREPQWSSPAVAAAVRAFGWEVLCQTELDDLNTTRAQFFRVFASLRDRWQRDENLASLNPPSPEHRSPAVTASPWDVAGFRRVADIVPIRRGES